MDVLVQPPDLRGTVLILDLRVRLDPPSLIVAGRIEIQPCYPADDPDGPGNVVAPCHGRP